MNLFSLDDWDNQQHEESVPAKWEDNGLLKEHRCGVDQEPSDV